VVRHVDDDRVRPEEQADLQPQSGLVVEHVFPEVMRDELRQHDRDRTFVILARSCIDVREEWGDQRPIGRLDDDQRDAVVARPPALAHELGGGGIIGDMHRRNVRRDRSREGEGV